MAAKEILKFKFFMKTCGTRGTWGCDEKEGLKMELPVKKTCGIKKGLKMDHRSDFPNSHSVDILVRLLQSRGRLCQILHLMDSEFLAIKWLSKQLILSFISINASTNIWKCYNMESLVSSSWLCSAPLHHHLHLIMVYFYS